MYDKFHVQQGRSYPAMNEGTQSFGQLLNSWRSTRGLSQLSLALESDVSQRHISFLESGRATPSRTMVLRLSEALRVPLAHRNALLVSAGFASIFKKSELHTEQFDQIRSATSIFLKGVEPAIAIIVDASWTLKQANSSANKFLVHLLRQSPLARMFETEQSINVMKLLFDQQGLRPMVKDWEATSSRLLQRLRCDSALLGRNHPSFALYEELIALPDISDNWRPLSWEADIPPAMTIDFFDGDCMFSFHSAVTMIGTPYDIALEELRMEIFFPANEQTRLALQQVMATETASSESRA